MTNPYDVVCRVESSGIGPAALAAIAAALADVTDVWEIDPDNVTLVWKRLSVYE